MKIVPHKTSHGTAVEIELSGSDIAVAISAWLVARRVTVIGARTITVNGELINCGRVWVDPSGRVMRKGVEIGLESNLNDQGQEASHEK